MNGTESRKRVLFVAAAATLVASLMILPLSFDGSGYHGWTLGALAQAEGGKGAGRGRGGSGGSHTDHDHSDSSHSDSDHSDHSDSSHDSGHESGGKKGGKRVDRGHRGHAVGGGSRMVEQRIFAQD